MSRARMQRIGVVMAGALSCLAAAGIQAAEPDALEARTGLNRTQIADLAGCMGKATTQLSLALGMLAGDTPDKTRAQAEATNQRLPEALRDTPDELAAAVAGIHAPPRLRLHEYGAAAMASCARRADIPLEGAVLARCYSLVSFVNAARHAGLGGDSAQAFAATWAPELARLPAELPVLREALAKQYEKGATTPVRELGDYLRCATDPSLATSWLIAPIAPPVEAPPAEAPAPVAPTP